MSELDRLGVTQVNRTEVLRDWLDPMHTALLIVDMQEEFTHPESNVSRWSAREIGVDVTQLPEYDPFRPSRPGNPDLDEIPRLRSFISECRRLGVHVIWILSRLTGSTDARFWKTVGLRNCYQGEWVERVSAGLEPAPEDSIVYKSRHSGFFGTELEDLLRNRAASTIMVTGRGTAGCVESTCRDGMARDFGVVLVADCCGPPTSTHEVDVLRIGRFYGFPTSSREAIEILEAHEPASD